jgi:hypothetical protein
MWSRDAGRYAGYFEINRGVSRIAVGWMSNPDKPEIIPLVGGEVGKPSDSANAEKSIDNCRYKMRLTIFQDTFTP